MYDVIWSESLWLPDGYTWKDLESTPLTPKTNVTDLCTVPVWVVFILVSRYLFERNVATPVCHLLGIKTSFTNTTKHVCCLEIIIVRIFGAPPNSRI